MANQDLHLPVRWKRVRVIIQSLSLLAIVLAVLALDNQHDSLDEQHKALEARYEWNRQHFTHQMISEFDYQIRSLQKSINIVTIEIFSKSLRVPK